MQKTAAKPPAPPKQNLKSIEIRLKKLDDEGWWKELTKLYLLSETRGLALHANDANVLIIRRGGKTAIGHSLLPIVQLVEPRNTDFQLSLDRLPALIVHLAGVPDAEIIEAVKRELTKARKSFPVLGTKPGRRALNGRCDHFTFKKWRRAQIVPLARLFAWRATLSPQDAKHYPDHVLGDLVKLDGAKAEVAPRSGTVFGGG